MAIGLVLNRRSQVPAENSPAFGAIAERFRRAGDLDRAVALCQEGLARFPDHMSALVTLGWALLDLGRHKEAHAELEQVIKRAPDNLAAIRGLAQLHDRMENADASDIQNPSAWQIVEDPEEPIAEVAAVPTELAAAIVTEDIDPVVPPMIEVAAADVAVGAIEFEIQGEAPAVIAVGGPAAPHAAAPAAEATGEELDAELERFLRAIGPPVAITVADEALPVAPAAAPAVAARAVDLSSADRHPTVDLVSPAEAALAANLAAPADSAVVVDHVAPAPYAATVDLDALDPVMPVALATSADPIAEHPIPVAQPAPAVVAFSQQTMAPADVPSESPAFQPETIEDEELPPAAEFVAAREAAIEPVVVLDVEMAPEAVFAAASARTEEPAAAPAPVSRYEFGAGFEDARPVAVDLTSEIAEPEAIAPEAAHQFQSELMSDVAFAAPPPSAEPVVLAPAAEAVVRSAAEAAPEPWVAPVAEVVATPWVASAVEAVEALAAGAAPDVLEIAPAVIEWSAPVQAAAIREEPAPEADGLLELLPEVEPVAARVAEPVLEVMDAPLLDLVDSKAFKPAAITIDIRPEPVARHDVPALVMPVKRERPAAPGPALVALEKFLRQVEVRKVRRMTQQPVAS